jgi:hypothetical protein
MFVANDAALIGNGDGYIRSFFEDDALTSKTAFNARIDGAIDEIFFFIRYFLQELLPFFHINVTSGTSANTAAVMVEVHVVVFRNFEQGLIQKIARYSFSRNAAVFKFKAYGCHKRQR